MGKNALQTIDEHLIIRETVGYDVIEKFEVWDLPSVLDFLTIVHNYLKMDGIKKENEN